MSIGTNIEVKQVQVVSFGTAETFGTKIIHSCRVEKECNTDIPTLAKYLAKRKLTLTSAESLTSGTFQSQLAATPQASQIYPGGFIIYATTAKTKLLGVPAALIAKYGVVSPEVAKSMAQQARKIAGTDFALAFTGVAGPDKLEGVMVGTVCIGIANPETTLAKTYYFPGEPESVMTQSCQAGIDLLVQTIQAS